MFIHNIKKLFKMDGVLESIMFGVLCSFMVLAFIAQTRKSGYPKFIEE